MKKSWHLKRFALLWARLPRGQFVQGTTSFSFKDRYRLTGILDTENLLNSTNAACSTSGGCSGAVINTAGAADFGRIISARTARNVQMGLKFNF